MDASRSREEQAKACKEKGNILFKEGKINEALVQYEKASSLDPTSAVYWSNQALCCSKLNLYGKMKDVAQQAIGCDETFLKGYYYLAKAEKELNELSNAVATLELGEARCETTSKGSLATTKEYQLFRYEVKADLQDKKDEEVLTNCRNCGRPDAPKVCTRCFMANYCNRECQKEHWKKHKPNCMEVDVFDLAHCQKCQKQLKNRRICAKCNKFSYCSIECQKQDWPNHKEMCKQNRQIFDTISAEHSTQKLRLQELFEQWKHRAQVFIQILATYGMTKQEFRTQPPSFVVWIRTEFNYNYMTFLPVAVPEKVAIKDLSDPLKSQFESVFSIMQAKKTEYNSYKHVALLSMSGAESLTSKGIPSLKPMIFASTIFQRYPIEQIHDFFKKDMTLNNEKLHQWAPVLSQNLKSQLTTLEQRAEDIFTYFLLGAYRVHSKKPQNLTHALQVTFEPGFQLGSVASLQSYELIKLAKARDNVRELPIDEETRKGFLSRLDVENYPPLLQSRIARPRNMMLPIIYRGHESNVYNIGTPFYEREEVPPMNHKKCDKQAQDMFHKLQQIAKSLPPVSSPDL